jgi:ferredoxin-nitrite reductase
VELGESEAIEGYHIHIGGAFGPHATLGREIYRDVKAQDAPATIERMLKAYVTNRASPAESFLAFANRHDLDALKALVAAEAS